jgi:SAM-dependent methyltransferase
MFALLKQGWKTVLDVFGLSAVVSGLRSRTKYWLDDETRGRNARFSQANAPDGLPMPPPYLIYLITSQFDAERFYQNGVLGAACVEQVLSRHGLDIHQFTRILDFGCGCGRVIRQWRKLHQSQLYGVDYNPRLINWCRCNLSFAEFAVNKSRASLAFPVGTFDFVYSISVFTHLSESDQRFWMDELTRILSPGGYLLFSVHGTTRLDALNAAEREQFAKGESLVFGSRYSKQNACITFHPAEYVEKVLCRDLRLVAFEPGAAKDANQDFFLMQKPFPNEHG